MIRLSSVISELHRRSVWQVLGSYAVGAWVILQLAETLEGLIGLPLWFGPAIVVVVLLGFPVLLVTTLVEGGKGKKDAHFAGAGDSGDHRDGSLSSWKPLDDNAFKAALRRLFTWRNATVGGVLMAVLLGLGTAGYSGMRSAGLGPMGSLQARNIFESEERMILADFLDSTGDGTLGETVTALFRIDLSQSPSVILLDRPQLAQALARMQRDPTEPITHDVAMELAQREGVKGVVTGEVLPLGPGAVVSARLMAAGTGETMVAVRETARTIDDVPNAVDRVSAQLRERIGESLRSIQGDPPLEEVTTSSLVALRKYVQAEWASDMGDVSTAEALVKEAIALDSTFSMAHRKLGIILSNEARDKDEAVEAFTLAYQWRDRLTTREQLLAEASYHTYVTEDLDAAVEAYERILAEYPTDGIAGNNLAVIYGERGEQDKAAELYLRSIERGTAPAVSYTNAVFALFEIGQRDSAEVILTSFREQHPGHPVASQYSAAFASAGFDYTTAEDHVGALLEAHGGTPRWEMWGNAELASYAMIRGKLNEGVERILRAHELQDEVGARFIEQPRFVFEATGLASLQLHFLQDPEGAVHTLDGVVESPAYDSLPPGERFRLAFAGLYAAAGRADRAREQLAAFRREPPPDYGDGEGGKADLRLAEGSVAIAEGNVQEGIRLLREGREALPDCKLCFLPELGEAYEVANKPDSALAVFEEYLFAPAFFRSQVDNLNLHRVLLGSARSYEALGRNQEAAGQYRRMLSLWSDADPGLQARVEGVRRKLSALGLEGP